LPNLIRFGNVGSRKEKAKSLWKINLAFSYDCLYRPGLTGRNYLLFFAKNLAGQITMK
jgi:hypothetical protein